MSFMSIIVYISTHLRRVISEQVTKLRDESVALNGTCFVLQGSNSYYQGLVICFIGNWAVWLADSGCGGLGGVVAASWCENECLNLLSWSFSM